MQTTISQPQSEKILPAALSNNPILPDLAQVDYTEWLKIRALGDLFFRPATMKAPEDIEIAYKVLSQVAAGPCKSYTRFCQDYLYRRMLKNIMSIEAFIDDFNMKDDYVKKFAFWKTSFSLISKRILQLGHAPSISVYIGWVPHLPALWRQAYPGLDSKEYRDFLIKQK